MKTTVQLYKFYDRMSSLIAGRVSIPDNPVDEYGNLNIWTAMLITEQLDKCGIEKKGYREQIHWRTMNKLKDKVNDVGVVSVNKDPYLCSMKKLR